MGGDSTYIQSLVDQIQKTAAETNDLGQDGTARAKLLQLSRQLTGQLEQPDELISNVAFSARTQPSNGGRNMCVRVADDLKLFDLLAEESPQTAQQLAETSNAEELLVIRIMRVLVGMGMAAQVDKTSYAATPATRQMTLPSVRAGIRFFYEEGLPVVHVAPAYFKSNSYQTPKSMYDGPFQYAFDTKEQCFEYWSKKPGVMENFNTFMQGLFGTPMRLGWTDWFPAKEAVLDGFDESRSEYAFVDVGGGRGHEGEAVLKKYPGVKGRFVVEDLPFVINDIENLNPRIERLAHDFTQPQPVKGARAYFLQNILHNWADPVCHTILTQLATAMIPGYSKLLIGNIIIPDTNASLRQSGLDIAMLVLHSGSQRGEAEWSTLLDRAGFKVVKFWHPPGDGDGIVEAELKG